MRLVDAALDAEVAGTTTGDWLEVGAWRGGEPVALGLDVTGWSMAWDADRSVQGQATFTIADPDGTLCPWSMSDALAPGGSRLLVAYVFGASGLRVPMGTWRIRSAEPLETWRAYDVDGAVQRVPGGGSVTLTADEETATVDLDRLDAERVGASTCVAEITRLLTDICAVTVGAGVIDRNVPNGLVYEESRLNAIESLAAVMGATHRMAGDGSFELVPQTGVGPVWQIAGGETGVLIHVGRSLSDDGLYNAVIANNQADNGRPLVGRAYLEAGPLAWAGPYGRVPMFKQSVGTTHTSVQADAASSLTARQAAGEVDLAVTCLAHPGIQPHDLVTVVAATTAGDQALVGRVVGMQLASTGTEAGTIPAKAMTLTVRVPSGVLEMIAGRVRRG